MAFDPSAGKIIEREKSSGFDPSKGTVGEPLPSPAPEPVEKKSIWERASNFLIQSEKKLGETLGTAGAIAIGATKAIDDAAVRSAEADFQAARTMRMAGAEQKKRLRGMLGDRPDVDVASEQIETINKTAKQVAGETLGVLVDMASFGTYGSGAKGAKSFQLYRKGVDVTAKAAAAKASKEYAKKYMQMTWGQKAGQQMIAFAKGFITNAPRGVAFGGTGSAAFAMQEDAEATEILERTRSGMLVGGIFSGVLGGMAERGQQLKGVKIEKLREKARKNFLKGLDLTKEKYKEKGAANVDEWLDRKWWGTRNGLLKKAQSGQALSAEEYKKIGELAATADEVPSLLARIDDEIGKLQTRPGITPSTNQKKVDTLFKLRQDVLNLTLETVGDEPWTRTPAYEDLRGLARSYGEVLYDSRKAQQTISDSQTLSQVKKVDGMIRGIVNEANPEYAKVNELYHASSELADTVLETIQRKTGRPPINLTKIALGGLGVGGAGLALGRTPEAVAAAGAIMAIGTIGNSTWWNTLDGSVRWQVANAIENLPQEQINSAIRYLAQMGPVAVEKLRALNQEQE